MRTAILLGRDWCSGNIFSRLIDSFDLLGQIEKIFYTIDKKHNLFATYDLFIDDYAREKNKIRLSYPVYIKRKLTKDSLISTEKLNPFGSNLAIIMQGPILYENNFTFRSIQRYLSQYPNVNVILSTWVTEDISKMADFVDKNLLSRLTVIQSALPIYPGIFNINYQITSSKIGIDKALEIGCEFSIKVRTDQMMFSSLALRRLKAIFLHHSDGPQGKRIFAVSLNTFAFRLYGVSDMFQFGRTTDLLNFWSAPLDSRKPSDFSPGADKTFRGDAEQNMIEVYLVTHYMRAKAIVPNFEFRQSLEVIRDLFCIIDINSIELIWKRHSNMRNKWLTGTFPSRYQEITFLDWLELQESLDFLLAHEEYIDKENFS